MNQKSFNNSHDIDWTWLKSFSSWDTRIKFDSIVVVGKQINSTILVKILKYGHRMDCEFKCDIHRLGTDADIYAKEKN